MQSSACDTLIRFCARYVLCWSAFPLVSALGSTGSAADRSALFVGFTANRASVRLAFVSFCDHGSDLFTCDALICRCANDPAYAPPISWIASLCVVIFPLLLLMRGNRLAQW